MRAKEEGAREPPAAASWPRRALVSLWLLAFVTAGGILAARWDALMARLAGPPAAASASEGALR